MITYLKKRISMKVSALLLFSFGTLWAQPGNPALPQPPKQYLKVQQFSAEEDSRVLKLCYGLSVKSHK